MCIKTRASCINMHKLSMNYFATTWRAVTTPRGACGQLLATGQFRTTGHQRNDVKQPPCRGCTVPLMRIVADTNTVVSGSLWPGKSRALLEAAPRRARARRHYRLALSSTPAEYDKLLTLPLRNCAAACQPPGIPALCADVSWNFALHASLVVYLMGRS